MTTHDHASDSGPAKALDKDSAMPLHAQLTELLRGQIRGGWLAPHTQLPSERELCAQCGVSRITVRQALGELLREGLIYTQVGKGTYVSMPRMEEELQPLSSFTDDMRRRGMVASSRLLAGAVANADDEQASRLRLPRGAEVVLLHRLRLANGLPIALQHTWLPHHLCRDLLRCDLSTRSLFEVLRTEYRLSLARAETNLSAALVQPEERRLLQMPFPAAVLVSEQTTYLDSGEIIEFVRSVFRSDRYTLHIRM
jgi:GntR family transcriptional regulator